MAIGPLVRKMFGPLERPIANGYRSLFFTMDQLVDAIAREIRPCRILEIGCGDGSIAERLVRSFPDAEYLGVDIAPSPGRLFQGSREKVTFRTATASEVAAEFPNAFDLVVICDVMHHVPDELQRDLLDSALQAMSSGGLLVFKDWEHRESLLTQFTYWLETRVSGVYTRYRTIADWKERVGRHVPDLEIVDSRRFRPWPNNFALFLRDRGSRQHLTAA